VVLALSEIVLAAAVDVARGQSVYSNPGTNPAAWGSSNSNPLLTGNATGGTPSPVFFGQLSGTPNSGMIQLRANGSASTTIISQNSDFEFVNNGTQAFTINTPSNVGLPLYLRGTVTLNETLPFSNLTSGFYTASFTIKNAANATVGAVSSTRSFDTATDG